LFYMIFGGRTAILLF